MNHDESMEPELSRDVIDSLDADHEPSRILENRIAGALRERGLLQSRMQSRRRARSPWLLGAAAAALAFAVGLRVGEQRTRPESLPTATSPVTDTSIAAQRIQRAAFDYITALSQARIEDDTARVVAVRTFRTAADQIMRLAPQSDIAVAIGLAFPLSFAASPASVATASSSNRIIWF